MDRRAKTDLKPLPFSGGDNNDVDFIDYDRVRKTLPVRETRSCFIGARTLSTEMSCPICLDLLSQTMTAKECLHRFCSECITMALQRGNKECPTCRKKLVSKRSLRPDPNFDLLISKVWPDRSLYETLQLAESNNPSSENNGADSAEEGVNEQEEQRRKRSVDESETPSKKPKTEDDDFDDFNGEGTSDKAMAELDLNDTPVENNARDDFDRNEDDRVFEGEIDLEFSNIEAFDNVSAPREEAAGGYVPTPVTHCQEEEYPGEWDGYDEYDPYENMNGLSAEQQEELQADLEELETLEYDDYESDYTDEEDNGCCDDDEDIEDLTADDIDTDSPPVNDGDEMLADDSPDSAETDANGDSNQDSKTLDSNADNSTADDTNTDATTSASSPPENQPTTESTSGPTLNGTDNGLSHVPRQSYVITAIPEFNPNFEEKFESISPPEVENGESVDAEGQDGAEGKEGSDSSDSTTTTFSSSGCTSSTSEESSSISIIFSDDDDDEFQLSTIFPTELPMMELDTQRPAGSGIMHGLTTSAMAAAASAAGPGPSSSILSGPPPSLTTTSASVMMVGSLPSLMSAPSSSMMGPPSSIVTGTPSFMMAGQPSTITSMMPNSMPSMMPPTTSSMMPPPVTTMYPGTSSSMLPGVSASFMPGPSVMLGPSSSMIAGPSSLVHGPSSTLSGNSGSIIKLPPTSLSALAEDLPPYRDPDAIERVPEGTGDEIRPPSNSIPPKERLNHWLANSPSSPQSPVEDMATMPERRADDVDMMEPAISGSEEMEAELLPALSLSARDCPEELLIPRYVRAKHDTKMEHLAEFIHQRAMEEAQSNQTDFDADPVPTIPKPKHFYVFSRNGGHHVRQIFLHETMTTASCAMTQGDHLIIFFDTANVELRGERQSILTDVVPPHFLSLPTV